MSTDQAQAVYAAEDLWEKKEPQARIKFGDWNEVWPFYWTLAERCREAGVADVRPPAVKPRKGALKAHYDSTTGTVHIPPYSKGGVWALNTGTAIHEFAHHLTPGQGHGPAFREAMVNCLRALGWNADLLAECYEEACLTTSEKDDGIVTRLSKIYAQADAPGRTAEEKKTFLEKAQRMASQHAIDLAMIRKRDADRNDKHERPITGELFSLGGLANVTQRNLAVELGSAICRAHGARCTIRGKSMYMTFYGYPEDVHLTELMLARVTPMMFEEAEKYVKTAEHKASGVATASAKITFCKHFAWEVGRRLADAAKEAEREAVAREAETLEITDGRPTSTELVLRDKEIEVHDYVEYEFKRQGVKGSWKGSNTSTWSGQAARAGESAAQSANLFGRKELG